MSGPLRVSLMLFSPRMHRARCGAVAAAQIANVETWNGAVDNIPFAGHHDPVGAMRAAQHERGHGIAVAGKAQLVELEQREVGGLADGDLAELGPADAGRRAFRGPA